MAFTSEEVDAAVDRYLYRAVEVPRTKTGARDIVALRDTVLDLLGTTLLIKPDSYFYLIHLAKNRLSAMVAAQLAALDSITESGPLVTRSPKKIRSTAELTNAKAAILELNAGLNARTRGINGAIGPAVERFKRSVDRFITAELAPNVVVSGDVVETADELKSTLASTWAEAADRHVDITAAAAGLNDALTNLGDVGLPKSVVSEIVSRVGTRLDELKGLLEGPRAAEVSREAFLDLITAKSLVVKSSQFAAPATELAPLPGDSAVVVPIDSDGDEAYIQGTESGPFSYASGTVLTLSINSGASTPSIVLPAPDTAELRSQTPLTFPWPNQPGGHVLYATATFSYSGGGGTFDIYEDDLDWANGPAAAAALTIAFPGLSITWDAGTSQLVVTDPGTVMPVLQLVDGSTELDRFANWFDGGLTPRIDTGTGATIELAPIVEAINAASGLIKAEEVKTVHATFTGEFTDEPAEQDTIWHRLAQGTDLVADGTTAVSSPTKNFEALGVTAGMKVVITAPGPSAGTRTVVSVSTNTMVLSSAVVTTAVGVFWVGPDYSAIPAGAAARVTGFEDITLTGLYRVDAGGPGWIHLTTDFPVGSSESSLSVTVDTTYIKLNANGTSTSSGIGVLVGSAGATALGLTTTLVEAVASLNTVELSGAGDFLARGIHEGSLLVLTSPALVDYDVEVVSATTSRMVFIPAVPYESGDWSYAARRPGGVAFETMQVGVTTYQESTYAAEDDFAALDALVGQLLRGASYSGRIGDAVEAYAADLTALLATAEDYEVGKERGIDDVIKMMREQGFDRALDMLLRLEVKELFAMDADGVSYKSNVIRRSADTTRRVAPASRHPTGTDGRRAISFRLEPNR